MKAKVYRVRGIPAHTDSEAVRALIADSFDNLAVEHITVWSLASTTITIPSENLPRKVVTVTFKETLAIIDEQADKSEWPTRSPQPLTLALTSVASHP